ncbi:Methylenetetrahydrofolate reductase [Candidatus Desulfarcum epimagneticum]|uniref:Methylenetetrahydrofolate reductase n=1 Tax=uncultured Desulfobacteraceae bacterium TaxID=218296 RepID=A0A484HM38_9BACT|nr:Methylenetetrahydrofolate reductase [uncultured Desulfobacteraceae bacterium]
MRLKRKFDSGEFAVLAEIQPPKGVDVSAMVSGAMRVKGEVTAFMTPEMTNAEMRMSSLGAAVILQQKGMETVMQANCRDRNRLALQADLLAAGACEIPNIMAVKGEETTFGDHHQARPAHDIDTLDLIRAAAGLSAGADMSGVELMGAPDFLIGASADPGVGGKSAEMGIADMKEKIEAGARFFVTPPIFDPALIESFAKKIDMKDIRVTPTVLLLKSLGMARYIARNVAGIDIPDATIDRIRKSRDKTRECVEIAAETAREIRKQGFAGVLISTMGWEDKLPDILKKI